MSSSRRYVSATCCNFYHCATCTQGMPSRRCCDGRAATFLRHKSRDLLQLVCIFSQRSSWGHLHQLQCFLIITFWTLPSWSLSLRCWQSLRSGWLQSRKRVTWLDAVSASFVVSLCLARFKSRTTLLYARNTCICHRLPCADIDSKTATLTTMVQAGSLVGPHSNAPSSIESCLCCSAACSQLHSVNRFGSIFRMF